MRTAVLAFILTVILAGTAGAAPVLGQTVLFRADSSHTSQNAIVVQVVSGGTVHLVVFATGETPYWYDGGTPGSVPSIVRLSIPEDQTGTTDMSWRNHPNIGLGTNGTNGAPGAGALVTSTTTPSFTLNGSGIRPSTTNDTILTFSVRIDASVSISGGADGTATLLCDTNATPTTAVAEVRGGNTGTLTVGLALTQTTTGELHYRVPAGYFCRITTTNNTGTPTFTLVRQVQQLLN